MQWLRPGQESYGELSWLPVKERSPAQVIYILCSVSSDANSTFATNLNCSLDYLFASNLQNNSKSSKEIIRLY